MERITGARHAGPGDIEMCSEVLSRLHKLRIRHAILIDFDTAEKCDDHDLLRKEVDQLTASLTDSSGKGGGGLL
ncbi:alpha-galactosidase A precursor [Penicillium capsulatum]|uniref:Alpha-galactosidase A n=1 Tax=Penicillium capsulatum TaxID=69766 RepID=A0A9W9HYI6_9EURO|nr:alpha-galactosidase A precursor [Penicillium capsulatum]KAJ6116597.1 alpha-galactosidase A precursor [Penicillium capsulatum]